MDLEARFITALTPYCSSKQLTKLWEQLSTAYESSFREYHKLTHLSSIFSYYDVYQDSIQNKEAVILAVFYHDFVYEIWKNNNEEESALKAIGLLQTTHFPLKQLQTIEDLILCTKHHTSYTSDQSFMIDFDLAILGQSKEVYTTYTQEIRKEYKIVPEIIYKNGRKKILEHFLDKNTIFQTAIFQSLYEKQARTNIKNEMKLL